ncbi:MAG: lipoyl(octanoyl) transferase LipB [Chitinophagales bacterium]|nr:lipoyl(octanoyl) transferase LipB [Chitinophagales bacterium]MDW8418752.1 lipoyl(octanoyl) transferase LipB [Chitinophagales bacterium]
MIWHELGLKRYSEVWQLQEQFFRQNITAKENGLPTTQHVILCEHHPVYTLGKSGKTENILVDPSTVGADFFKTDRGGDVTFHGPGQLVVYPILDLDYFKLGTAAYVHRLEETILRTLKNYNIAGERLPEAPGIWLLQPFPRKIAAIGIRVSRGITQHGIAINVNTDLSYFTKIIPCGLAGKAVTSVEHELRHSVPMNEFAAIYKRCFESIFDTHATVT